MKKPEPVNKHVICSVCGLDWHRHGAKPTLETCVSLLKQDLALAQVRPVPFVPYPRPIYPWPNTTWISSSTSTPPLAIGAGAN